MPGYIFNDGFYVGFLPASADYVGYVGLKVSYSMSAISSALLTAFLYLSVVINPTYPAQPTLTAVESHLYPTLTQHYPA